MFFENVKQADPDPIFGMVKAYQKDPRDFKVNLMVGVYHNDQLKTGLIPTVKEAKKEIFEEDLRADYLPIEGLHSFGEELGQLLFGTHLWKGMFERIAVAQTPGGTGALRLGAELLEQEVSKHIYIPDPTWGNHKNIFTKAKLNVKSYPYYSSKKRGVDFEAMVHAIQQMEEGSIILLHAVCHNPTGCDPTEEEWKILSKIIQEKRLFPFFDCAYQGFGFGLHEDRRAIELFLADGHEMFIAYSCSKNFSLYCQRVGALFTVQGSKEAKVRVESQLLRIIRGIYSNPPAHGALIVSRILGHVGHRKTWERELEEMRSRLIRVKGELIDHLSAKKGLRDFHYLKQHKGMFSYLDLTPPQVERMIREFGIYLLNPGRISIAGLSSQNIPYVVDSLAKVLI